MLHKFTLRLSVFLLLASFGSSASACCLLPVLNPFAWIFGHGCGYGQGYGYVQSYSYGHGYGYGHGQGYGSHPWYGSGCGRFVHQGGYQGHQGSIYNPGYPSIVPSAGCDCTSNAVTPTMAPATTGAAWPSSVTTPQASLWGIPGGWSPQRQWTPPATAWQTQQFATAGPMFAPAQTAMSTAPIYGPTYDVTVPASQVAGDIRGDHEYPVIPNGYNSAAAVPIQRVGYQPRQRPVRQYSQAIR